MRENGEKNGGENWGGNGGQKGWENWGEMKGEKWGMWKGNGGEVMGSGVRHCGANGKFEVEMGKN